MPKMFQFAESA